MNGRAVLAAAGAASVVVGLGAILADMLAWNSFQSSVTFASDASQNASVADYFVAQLLATLVTVGGALAAVRGVLGRASAAQSAVPSSIRETISLALASARGLRLGFLLGLAYAVLFAFTSSTVIYQPGIDFGQAYGVTSPSWTALACCGTPGTIPKLIAYIPQYHLGFELTPLTALFLVFFPMMVGFNVVIASYGFTAGRVKPTGRWLGGIGAGVGLFAACPTCAGYFLASMVAGAGGATLAVALASYQLFFVLVSIPTLVLGPVVVAAGVKRMLFACRVPPAKP